MIEQFVKGRYYHWIGQHNIRPDNFNDEGLMDYLLDGKAHKCVEVGILSGGWQDARFDKDNHRWSFGPEERQLFSSCNAFQEDLP